MSFFGSLTPLYLLPCTGNTVYHPNIMIIFPINRIRTLNFNVLIISALS